MRFEIDKNIPNDEHLLYESSEFEFNPGVTVLVGCNGSGKSTLIKRMTKSCKEKDIPYFNYDAKAASDNLLNRSTLGANWDAETVANQILSRNEDSEGENMMFNLSEYARDIGNFVFNKVKPDHDSAFVFFDSIDSGWSIDQIHDFQKDLIGIMFKSLPEGIDLYVVVSANQYETTQFNLKGVNCEILDVQSSSHISFKSYEEYKDFVLESRRTKNRFRHVLA